MKTSDRDVNCNTLAVDWSTALCLFCPATTGNTSNHQVEKHFSHETLSPRFEVTAASKLFTVEAVAQSVLKYLASQMRE